MTEKKIEMTNNKKTPKSKHKLRTFQMSQRFS